ncbi:VOC family protein [Streptomyces sp. P5-A9]|uniref:VOC family protein n=1 Tax=Streptomyces sp. P5-A9 TaxID=3071730 RepID=UPI003FCE1BFB
MIFVNITTTDLERSKAFYTALGCDINPMFTDENAAGVVWDENTNFMALTRGHFSQFTGARRE